jgi:nucleotide-binding universal stress UspA family protein
MPKRILVPLDGSACARHAFQYALGLAKAESAVLEIYAIVDPSASLPPKSSRAHARATPTPS